jgi:hypothetical protein
MWTWRERGNQKHHCTSVPSFRLTRGCAEVALASRGLRPCIVSCRRAHAAEPRAHRAGVKNWRVVSRDLEAGGCIVVRVIDQMPDRSGDENHCVCVLAPRASVVKSKALCTRCGPVGLKDSDVPARSSGQNFEKISLAHCCTPIINQHQSV